MPDFPTLYRFLQRLDDQTIDRGPRNGAPVARSMKKKRKWVRVAVGATGLALGAVSTFFVRRMHHHGQKPLPWRHWLKWVVAIDLDQQFVLSQLARRDCLRLGHNPPARQKKSSNGNRFTNFSGPSVTASSPAGIVITNLDIESNTITRIISPWILDSRIRLGAYPKFFQPSHHVYLTIKQSKVSGSLGYRGGTAATFRASSAGREHFNAIQPVRLTTCNGTVETLQAKCAKFTGIMVPSHGARVGPGLVSMFLGSSQITMQKTGRMLLIFKPDLVPAASSRMR